MRWPSSPSCAADARAGFVDNDCNLFTLGIHRVELKGKPQNMVGAFLGTGFGGGVILNGELFRGHNYAAGEFGQMTIDKNGLKTAHSFRGSLESLASRTGIVRHLRKAVLEGEETMLLDELGQHLTGVRSRICAWPWPSGIRWSNASLRKLRRIRA